MSVFIFTLILTSHVTNCNSIPVTIFVRVIILFSDVHASYKHRYARIPPVSEDEESISVDKYGKDSTSSESILGLNKEG